jgi:hypothetical protein
MSNENEYGFNSEENLSPEEIKEAAEGLEYSLPHIIHLDNPIAIGNNGNIKRSEIVFKNELTFDMTAHLHLSKLQDIQSGHLKPIICGMTGEPPAVIGALKGKDAAACIAVASFFLMAMWK